MWQLCHKLLSASFCGCCQWWAHPFGALWSFLLWMTSISVSALSKKVNDRLIWRAVGRQNQTEAYLAIMKQSGNENGPLGSQMFVCKNYKWHISFVYLTTVCPISMGLIFTMPPSAISLCMWTWANVENIYCIFKWTHWPAVWASVKGEWREMSPTSQWPRTPPHPSMGIKEIQSRKNSCKYIVQ